MTNKGFLDIKGIGVDDKDEPLVYNVTNIQY